MVMRLPAVMSARGELLGAIIHGTKSQKPMLQRLVSLFVPFKMTDHFLLFYEDLLKR